MSVLLLLMLLAATARAARVNTRVTRAISANITAGSTVSPYHNRLSDKKNIITPRGLKFEA
jgi:hypothetical protein